MTEGRHTLRVPGVLLAIGVAGLLLTGCVPGPDETPDGSITDAEGVVAAPAQVVEIEAPVLTASEALSRAIADEIAAKGEVSIQNVVDAVDLTLVDMPGASTSRLEPGDGLGSSYVLSLLQGRLDELTYDQRVIAEEVLADTPDPAGDLPYDGPVGLTVASMRESVATWNEVMTKVALLVYADWQAKLPSFPTMLVTINASALHFKDNRAFDAGLESYGGSSCHIRYYIKQLVGFAPQDFRTYLAHELFHCYQHYAQSGPVPGWVVEGSADWAGIFLYGDRQWITPMYLNDLGWFTNPELDLSARKYAAWALFVAFGQDGGNVLKAVQTLLQLAPFPQTTLALDKAGITSPWYSSAIGRLSTRYGGNPDWTLNWPATGGVPAVAMQHADIKPGPVVVQAEKDVVAHKAALLKLSPRIDILELQAGPSGFSTRVDGQTLTVMQGGSVRMCIRDDQCVCPGEGIPNNQYQMSNTEVIVAFNPLLGGKTVRGEARVWDPTIECEREKKPRASSNGDPHLLTYDGYGFTVMSLGEFVNTRDPEGGYEIQTRHELYGDDELPGGLGALGAAVGTSSVAIQLDESRVTFTSSSFAEDPGDVTVRVDGKKVAVPYNGDVTIEVGDQKGRTTWTATGKDGSAVQLLWWSGFFVTAEPTQERAARTVGLLGAMDGNAANDLLLPDGTPLPNDASLEDVYAQAWLVTDADSLFDYGPGESAEYFHLPLPPLGDTIGGLIDFFNTMNGAPPNDEAAVAYDTCEDTLGPDATRFEVQSCAYDVTVTGDGGFMDAYATQNEILLEGAEFDWLWDMFMPGSEPKPGVTEPKSGEPSLVLDATHPAGTVRVPEGAVVTFRTNNCDDGWVRVDTEAFETDDAYDSVALCADDVLNSLFSSGGAIDGEAYGIANDGGAYVFSFDAESATPGTRIEITVDTEPTVETDRLGAVQFNGRVRDLGDAEVFLVTNPTGGAWSQTGVGADACVLVYPTFHELGGGTGFHSLGAECIQDASFSVVPTFDGLLPVALVVVARTDHSTRFTLSRG